jgi:hypothetical protein
MWGKRALILAVVSGAGCTVQPLDPNLSTGAGGTGAGGVTGTGGFADTGGATGGGGYGNVNVVGDWYVFSDGIGPNVGVADAGSDNIDSDCVGKGGFPPTACTQITSPAPGQPFAPTDLSTNEYCTSGTAAMVLIKDGSPDYSDLWGGGMGLNFYSSARDAGGAGYSDLSGYTGISFDFRGDLVPPFSMRVDFPFMGEHGTDAPYWDGGGDRATAYSPLTGTTASPQHVEIKWADVGGPQYLMAEVPPVDVADYPFDPRAVQGIQFLVFTNASTVTPYSFCVANLALMTN